MQIACACASASIAMLDRHRPFLRQHGLGHHVREGRTVGELAARARCASASSCSAATSLLKKPQRSPSSADMVRPVKSSSAARPCPMTRGSMAQAPMSQPASPTRVNRNAGLRLRRAEAHIAEQRDHRTGADADAIDRGDHRLRTGMHRLDQIAGHAREGEQALHVLVEQRAR